MGNCLFTSFALGAQEYTDLLNAATGTHHTAEEVLQIGDRIYNIERMDGASLNQLLARFPRVVLAVLGISGVDVETPGGYYAVLAFYAVICASLYGASLGAGAVNREAVDKTYEFLFTRPRSRAAILSM